MRKLTRTMLAAASSLALPLLAGGAQSTGESQPFLLAVASQALPRAERAVIIRTANAAQMDLIVLAPDANAQHTLLGAITLLRTLRQKSPVPPATDVASMQFAEAVVAVPAERRGRLDAVLRQVQRGEIRRLAEFGEVHAIVVNPRSVQ